MLRSGVFASVIDAAHAFKLSCFRFIFFQKKILGLLNDPFKVFPLDALHLYHAHQQSQKFQGIVHVFLNNFCTGQGFFDTADGFRFNLERNQVMRAEAECNQLADVRARRAVNNAQIELVAHGVQC